MGDAIAASTAIPGYFRPVLIGGQRFVDGGAWSMHSLDLLAGAGLDLVIVSAPMSTADLVAPEAGNLLRVPVRRQLDREVAKVRAAGTRVVTFQPDAALRHVMGSNRWTSPAGRRWPWPWPGACRRGSRRTRCCSNRTRCLGTQPLRPSLSAADAISQVEHPVALDDHAGILENLLRPRAEEPLALAEHHGYDVHRHLVHEAERERLAADVPGADRDDAVTGPSLRLFHRGRDVLEERDISLGMPPSGFGRWETTTRCSPAGGWASQPLVRSNR